MAKREQLAIIRNARAGQVVAQLELGRRYLFGGASLPQSLPTALHWLERAARQHCAQAWQLIGDHIPLALAHQSGTSLVPWYELAYDHGSMHAGLVFAQLVLTHGHVGPQRSKAMRALAQAAQSGYAEAQALLAQHGAGALLAASAASGFNDMRHLAPPSVLAQHAKALDAAWAHADWAGFLAQALPLARALVAAQAQQPTPPRLTPAETSVLSRCARLLDPALTAPSEQLVHTHAIQEGELTMFWQLAAAHQDRWAELALGLAQARMRIDGSRVPGAGVAHFKKAIRWLTQAGEQGLAEAWFALSRIYSKPEFSQRNLVDAQRYLERAADMGYCAAQLECGQLAWRARREHEGNDVRAVYWLQKAHAQGAREAAALLGRIAPRLATAFHTEAVQLLDTHAQALVAHPLLAARIELAALFHLSRAEALLLDVRAADQGHCLVIDIRASYGRSKRRLVMVETAQERQALTRIGALFESFDEAPAGAEGNYRQRLYRLRTLTACGAGQALDATELAA